MDKTRFEQVHVSASLAFFAKRFMAQHALRPYDDLVAPAIFYGCYRPEDEAALAAHQGPALLIWGGTDITFVGMLDRVKAIRAKRLPWPTYFLAGSAWIERDLQQGNLPYIRRNLTPVDPAQYPETPLGQKIYVYGGSEKHQAFYGVDFLPEIQAALPDVTFEVAYAVPPTFEPTRMAEVYAGCLMGLRLVSHDACSCTVVEMGLMGRKCVWNGDLPNAIPWKSVEDVIEAIRQELPLAGQRRPELAAQMRQAIALEDWLYLDLYENRLPTHTWNEVLRPSAALPASGDNLTRPLFSVCVFTYNRSEWLQNAVRSVFAQHYRGFELIVVDDGSVDDTQATLARLQDEMRERGHSERFRVVRHYQNRGRAAARNSAVQLASGQFVVWLADDDLLYPQHLSTYERVLGEHPEVDVLYCQLRANWIAQDRVTSFDPLDFSDNQRAVWFGLLMGAGITDGGAAVKRELYATHGGYDERFLRAQDYQFWLRLSPYIRVRKVPEELYEYVRHPDCSFMALHQDLSFESLALQEAIYLNSLPWLFSPDDTARFDANSALAKLGQAFHFVRDYFRATVFYQRIQDWSGLEEQDLVFYWQSVYISGQHALFKRFAEVVAAEAIARFGPEARWDTLDPLPTLCYMHRTNPFLLRDSEQWPILLRYGRRRAFFINAKHGKGWVWKHSIGFWLALAEWAEESRKPRWAFDFYWQGFLLNPTNAFAWEGLERTVPTPARWEELLATKQRFLRFPAETPLNMGHSG